MQKLSSVIPMDPGILKTKAIIYESMGDLSSAYECREESFKCLPSDVAVLSWLADYYFQSQYYEKAMEFFEKCILVEDEVKWYLAIGTCQQVIIPRPLSLCQSMLPSLPPPGYHRVQNTLSSLLLDIVHHNNIPVLDVMSNLA